MTETQGLTSGTVPGLRCRRTDLQHPPARQQGGDRLGQALGIGVLDDALHGQGEQKALAVAMPVGENQQQRRRLPALQQLLHLRLKPISRRSRGQAPDHQAGGRCRCLLLLNHSVIS
ncbi:MAG: hypothetical protein ACK559_03770, partial [bacterium]